ncbi:pantetheine-phosphate adenylyltransferase [Haloarchaeobius sp. HRN-SO-5]|uniref:pantetheine-phosphate adenylyltransferase n=1 Tax=Haloarchaeobius sp. HRN-SO-5 TaxID=3446118 RepID=UPI003EB8047E
MRAAVAGTFGPIHDGHRSLLETALDVGSDGVVVGLTSDEFATASRDREVPGFTERVTALRRELDALDRWGREVEVREIAAEHDFAATDETLDALVVSRETAEEVPDLNEVRRENGLEPLVAVVVPLVRAHDGDRLSSTRVVAGEVDEHGRRRRG